MMDAFIKVCRTGFCAFLLFQGGTANARELEAEDPLVENNGKAVLGCMGKWSSNWRKGRLEQKILREFAYLHPQLEIHSECFPDRINEKACQLIVEMIRSGNYEWTVVKISDAIKKRVGALLGDPDWDRKHLVNMMQVEGFTETQRPAVIEQFNGAVYGPSVDAQFFCTWYNREVARRVGLDLQGDDLSYETLLQCCQRIHEFNQTAKVPASAMMDFTDGKASLKLFMSLLISRLEDDEGGVTLSLPRRQVEEALFEVLKALEALAPYRPLATQWLNEDRDRNVLKIMQKESILFFFETTGLAHSGMNRPMAERVDQWGIADLPGFRPHQCVLGTFFSSWGVMKESPVRDAGIELMKFWSRPEMATIWIRETGSPTGLSGIVYDPKFTMNYCGLYQERKSLQSNHSEVYFPAVLLGQYWKRSKIEGKALAGQLHNLLRGRVSAEELFNQIKGKPAGKLQGDKPLISKIEPTSQNDI